MLLLFVQHNILPGGGHRSEPSYIDLWLVDSIMCGRKVNLGYLIVQHMANGLSSAHSVLPYGMLLTTLFQACDVDLDSESDIRISKPFDAIKYTCIARSGYEFDGRRWVKKAGCAPAMVDIDTDEEAEMDIPPPSPTTPASPHSPPPAPSATASASSTPPDWYHDLLQRIDMLNLDLQALSKEKDRQFGVLDHHVGELQSQQAEILRILKSQFPSA